MPDDDVGSKVIISDYDVGYKMKGTNTPTINNYTPETSGQRLNNPLTIYENIAELRMQNYVFPEVR